MPPASSPRRDPEEMFISAEMHRRSAKIAFRKQLKGSRKSRSTIPSFVLLAFSLELYLKCLIALEAGTPRDTHSYKKLFQQLNGKTQNKLRVTFSSIARLKYGYYRDVLTHQGKAHWFTADLDTALEQSGNAFELFRYSYEDPTKPHWNADPAIEALREMIVNLNPAWKRHLVGDRNK